MQQRLACALLLTSPPTTCCSNFPLSALSLVVVSMALSGLSIRFTLFMTFGGVVS